MSGTAEAEQTQENKHRILAFDIGIKNLAYCLLERTAGGKAEILSWQNVNLLNEGKEVAKAAKVKCNSCSVGASYAIMHCGDTGLEGKGSYCQRHIPASAPALIDASGTVLKTVPALKVLKESAARLSLGKPQGKAAQTRDGWLALFSDKYSLPLKAFAYKDLESSAVFKGSKLDGVLSSPFVVKFQFQIFSFSNLLKTFHCISVFFLNFLHCLVKRQFSSSVSGLN